MINYEKEFFIIEKNRSIKAVSQSGYSYKATPTITLKGQWLKELGLISEIMFPSAVRMESWLLLRMLKEQQWQKQKLHSWKEK